MDPITALAIIASAIKIGSSIIDAAQKLRASVETAQAEGRDITPEEAVHLQALQAAAVEALRLQLIAAGAEIE